MSLAVLEFVVKVGDIYLVVNQVPGTMIGHVVNTDDTTGSGILESGTSDCTDAEVGGFFEGHVVSVVSVEHTVGESASRADSEELSSQSGRIIIDIVQRSACIVGASEHGTHGESISLVLAHDTTEHHGSHGDGRSLAVAQLVGSALHCDVGLPELAIGGTTGHRSEEEVVDLDNFANLVRRDERALSGSGINSDEDTFLEFKGKGGGTLGEVSHLGGEGLQVLLESNLLKNG